MENKQYYTPDISDLFVGYEYEFHSGTITSDPELMKEVNKTFVPVNIWTKETISNDPWEGRSMQSAIEVLKNGQMRTAYLSKEDIEKEGWEFTPGYYVKGGYTLVYGFIRDATGRVLTSLHIYNTTLKMTVYIGNCKSINEFRKILGYLNIK